MLFVTITQSVPQTQFTRTWGCPVQHPQMRLVAQELAGECRAWLPGELRTWIPTLHALHLFRLLKQLSWRWARLPWHLLRSGTWKGTRSTARWLGWDTPRWCHLQTAQTEGQGPGKQPPLLSPRPAASTDSSSAHPGGWCWGRWALSLQMRLVALPEMTSPVRQTSSLGSFLISDTSHSKTLPTP